MRANITALLAALVAVAAVAAPVHAFPDNRRMLRVTYNRPVGCGACHGNGGGSDLTAYGEAWQKAGGTRAAFARVEAQDSDGDGIDNGTELRGGGNPGDPASTPTRPGRTWLIEQKSIPIPEAQLQLVFGATEAIEAAEYELAAAPAAALEAQLGRPIGDAARAPTLYFAVAGGAKQQVAAFVHYEKPDGIYSLLIGLSSAGKVTKVAMFRAGPSDPIELRPFLDCLAGHGRADLPSVGPGGCPPLPGHEQAQREIRAAVEDTLWVVATVLGGGAAPAATPPPAAAPAHEVAPATAPLTMTAAPLDAKLDFAHVETTSKVTTGSSATTSILVFASLVLFAGVVLISARLGRHAAARATPTRWIAQLAPHYQLLCALVVLSLLLALAGGAASAYVQIRVVNASAAEYFHQMSPARLLGLSHVHVFGYTMTYGVLAAIACGTSLRESHKALLVSALMWAGPFDVLSWWGIQQVTPRFELLTNLCGATSGVASLIALVAVGRDLLRALLSSPEA